MKQIVLRNEPKGITLIQQLNQIVLQGGPIVANILPFTATATALNQTVFQPLNAQGQPIVFSQLICAFIMGIGQNILTGDYTYSNGIITFSQGLPIGYYIFGAGQI
jgi:hypothetical protein